MTGQAGIAGCEPSPEERAAQVRCERKLQRRQEEDARTRALEAKVRADREGHEAIERANRRHHKAALKGDIFDADILVKAFRDDWLQVQKDTGLTPMELSQDIKQASPVVGLGAGYLTGDPIIGLLAGVVAFLASDAIAEDEAQGKLKKWQSKWERIFSKLSQQELALFAETLSARHPMVWQAIANSSDLSLLAGHRRYVPD